MAPDEKPLTVAEMAAYLKRSEYSVRKYAKEGELPGHKVGREWRFFLSEVHAAWTARALETERAAKGGAAA